MTYLTKKAPLFAIILYLLLLISPTRSEAYLPGAFGRMEAEALTRISRINVSEPEKARLRREVKSALEQASREHQYAMEVFKRTEAYVDAGGVAPESFKQYLNESGKILGMMGDGALIEDTLTQMEQLGNDPYLPEEAKGTSQALTALGAVMQKAGDQLNSILPGFGDAIAGYGQISQKLAGLTSEVAKARTMQVDGYFQNVRGGSAEDELLKRVGGEALARHMDLWDSGIPVVRADVGQGEDRFFLKVGNTYEEVKDLNELKKIVGDWRVTHNGANPDPTVIKTLINGGKVEDKYVTWDKKELDWTARARVEVAVQDNLLRKSLGDSDFEKFSAEERRDLREQLHLFAREIENLGGVVADDRLARLFNNALIQGNKDRILKNLVYQQDPQGFDRALERKGMTLEDVQNPYDLQQMIADEDSGLITEIDAGNGGGEDKGGAGGGGFSFFKNLREQEKIDTPPVSSEKKAWEPRTYVLLRNETPEFEERKKELKNNLQEQIKKINNQISELRQELKWKTERTMEVQRRSLKKVGSSIYNPNELNYKGKVYNDTLDILEVQRQEKLLRNESVYQLKQLVKESYQSLSDVAEASVTRQGPFQDEGSYTRYFATEAEPGVVRVTSFHVGNGTPSSMSTTFYRYNSNDMTPLEFLGFLTTPGMSPDYLGKSYYVINNEGRLVQKGWDYKSRRLLNDIVEIELTDQDLMEEEAEQERIINAEYDWLLEYNRNDRERELQEIRNHFAWRENELRDRLSILEDRLAVIDGASDSVQAYKFYSEWRIQKDPGLKELMDLVYEFEAIQRIEEDPAIAVTVDTEGEWDRIFSKKPSAPDHGLKAMEQQPSVGSGPPSLDPGKDATFSNQLPGHQNKHH